MEIEKKEENRRKRNRSGDDDDTNCEGSKARRKEVMDIASSSSSAAAPAPADADDTKKYDVFISFRGEDTRRTFTSHLHAALLEKKITTYIDDKLKRGDEIAPALLQAITESELSVIIFSKDYASSTWCLDELVHILECKEKHGQLVLPIFYDTLPSDVRKQRGSYALDLLEQRFENRIDKVHTWRDALTNAANISGLDSKNYGCTKNMNSLVLSLAPKFTRLQTLILRQDHKPQLEDSAVESIANFCHDLQVLDLSKSFKLSDRSLYALAHGCPNLTKLNISGCSAFSDIALEYLAGCCRKLKVLNLCGCVRTASDRALQGIGRYCSQLQSLNIGWCEDVSDVGVMSLAYGCPDLRTVDLCGCVLISDDSVIALANRCPHLQSLHLYYCNNITDRVMYSLSQSIVKNKPAAMWESRKTRNDDTA